MTRGISRRAVFRTAGTLSLAAVLGTLIERAPAAAAADTSDFVALRSRWVDQLTGRTVISPTDPDFKAALLTLDVSVSASQALLVTTAGRTSVFSDALFNNEAMIVTTYKRLAQMATAWATPGAAGYQDATLLQQVLDGLADTNRLIYNTSQAEFGNWWSWEIGSSKALADAMTIVHDQLSADQLAAYCAAIDHFVPDPHYQFPPSRGRIVSVGANRVDLSQAVIVRSIAGDDLGRLQNAVSGLSDVWQYVTTSNGFYRDGSFIQHSTIPYTGSYGVVLIGGLAKLFALLSGSSMAVTDPSVAALYGSVESSFAPLIYDAQMMDSVRGRAVSRDTESSHDDAYLAIEAILILAQAVDDKIATAWRSLCAGWIARDTFGNILAGASLPATALVKALLASGAKPAAEKLGHTFFPSMDRSVHRGHGFALTLSMSSKRITWYECGNGENNKGAQEGSGMTYLYNGDNGHFDDDFWPTVNLSRLPGITVDTMPLPDQVEGQWGANTPQGEWTGGAVLGGTAAVGQNLFGPGTGGLQARKSWFFHGDVIVALGSDIHNTSGFPVETVVENRNLHLTGTNAIHVDGRRVADGLGASASVPRAHWAHLDEVAGYLVLDRSTLNVLREERTGSWSANNIKGSTTPVNRRYATLWFDHGSNPSAGRYAYAILPGASMLETEIRSRIRGFSVVRNDARVQAAWFYDGTLATNFWAADTVYAITAADPLSMVCRLGRGTLELAVADPTQTADSVTLTLGRIGCHKVDGATAVAGRDGSLRITVNTAGTAGATHAVTVHLNRPWIVAQH